MQSIQLWFKPAICVKGLCGFQKAFGVFKAKFTLTENFALALKYDYSIYSIMKHNFASRQAIKTELQDQEGQVVVDLNEEFLV